MIHILNGKPLSECTREELEREWSDGMMLESQAEVFSKEDNERLLAVEREMCSRPDPKEEE